MSVDLPRARIINAKRAFSTRRVPQKHLRRLITGDLRPEPGDLVLARVEEILKHTKLELTDGRRAHMFAGDEIVVAFGHRYAPDQYEAIIGENMAPCDLVAAGGLAAVEISRHQRMLPPTRIAPLGLLARADGSRINLRDYGVRTGSHRPAIPAILSLGTSMNAGKTLAAMSMVRGFKRLGHKVAALKITGTGAGGDQWIMHDAGADVVADFTDAGFASTYLAAIPEIEAGCMRLLNHAAAKGCDIAVIEIADGLQQLETAQLIRSTAILDQTIGTVFAAYDAMGAKYGVDLLRSAGHNVIAISGRLGRSPLGVREAEAATGLRVYSPWDLQEGMLVPTVRRCAVHRIAVAGGGSAPLRRVARDLRSAVQEVCGVDIDCPVMRRDRAARAVLAAAVEAVMSAEADMLCTAGGAGRANRRNGSTRRRVQTALGEVWLRMPRLRHGSFATAAAIGDVPRRIVEDLLDARTEARFEAALHRLLEALGGAAPADFDAARRAVRGAIEMTGRRPDPEWARLAERDALGPAEGDLADEVEDVESSFDDLEAGSDERHAEILYGARSMPDRVPLRYIPVPGE